MGIAGAAPAHAAGASMTLDVTPTLYVEAQAATGAFQSSLDIAIGVTGGTADGPRRLTVDASALAGQVIMTDLDSRNGCSADGLTVTCDVDPAIPRLSPFHLLAGAGAQAQSEADLTVSVSAAGAAPATAHVTAVIGTPGLLTAVLPERTGAPPGTVLPFSPVIGNVGDASPRHGFVLDFRTSDPSGAPADERSFAVDGERPGNCHYALQPRNDFWCSFPDEIAPGEVWTIDRPLAYRTLAPLMDGYVTYGILPAGSVRPSQELDPAGYTTGDGPALTLRRVPYQETGLGAGWLHVVADQHADYRAVGGTLRGKPGQVVTLDMGVRNAGPGSVTRVSVDGGFDVRLPAGISLVRTARVTPLPPGTGPGPDPLCVRQPSGVHRCAIREPLTLHGQFLLRFSLRVDRLVAHAAGQVVVVPSVEMPTHDPDVANDTAAITVAGPGSGSTGGGSGGSASGGTGSGGTGSGGSHGGAASGSTSGSASGATSGAASGSASGGLTPDGSLAATGSGAVPAVAGATAALLLVGAATVAVVRRRS